MFRLAPGNDNPAGDLRKDERALRQVVRVLCEADDCGALLEATVEVPAYPTTLLRTNEVVIRCGSCLRLLSVELPPGGTPLSEQAPSVLDHSPCQPQQHHHPLPELQPQAWHLQHELWQQQQQQQQLEKAPSQDQSCQTLSEFLTESRPLAAHRPSPSSTHSLSLTYSPPPASPLSPACSSLLLTPDSPARLTPHSAWASPSFYTPADPTLSPLTSAMLLEEGRPGKRQRLDGWWA